LAIEPFAIRADWADALPSLEQELDRRSVDAFVDAREIDGLAQMLEVGRLQQDRHRTAERFRPLDDDASHRGHRVGLTLRVEEAGNEEPGQVFELRGWNMHRSEVPWGRLVQPRPGRDKSRSHSWCQEHKASVVRSGKQLCYGAQPAIPPQEAIVRLE